MSKLKEGRKVIDGYRVTITKAYRMDEQGTGYSLTSWSGDTEYYEGEFEPMKFSIPEDWRVSESVGGDVLLYGPETDRGYTLQEAVDMFVARPLTADEHYTEKTETR